MSGRCALAAAAAAVAGLAYLRMQRRPRASREAQILQEHGYPPLQRVAYTVKSDPSDEPGRDRGLIDVARALCPAFRDAAEDDVRVVVLQGGITNQLYLLTHAPSDAKALVRLYGLNTELLIDRELECYVFHILAQLRFGPPLFGLFTNGRVEGYVPSKGLTPTDMAAPETAQLIAAELARMHALDVPVLPKAPHLWPFLKRFEEMVHRDVMPRVAGDPRLQALRLPQLSERLTRLEEELPSQRNGGGTGLKEKAAEGSPQRAAMDFLFEVLLCHNDLLSGNVLLLEKEQRVQFIDFEYGKYNFRGFDIANHFCEYAGFDFDLGKWYPSRAAQRAFLERYVAAQQNGALAARLAAEGGTFADAFFEACSEWLDRFAVASHFLWGQWALLQMVYSPIDFDYLEYAELRLKAIDY